MNCPTKLDDSILKRLKDIEFALDASTGIVIIDASGIIQYANAKYCELCKYDLEELIGNDQNMVHSESHTEAFLKDIQKATESGNVWKGEIKNKAKDGSNYWADTTIVPFMDAKGKPYQYIVISHNITARKKYEEIIESLAYTDSLTKLPNRNQFSKWIHNQPKKQDGIITALFLDLDNFKAINDNFGHDMGDFILKTVAGRLKENLRETGFTARLGGDEFIVILNNNENPKTVKEIAKTLVRQLSLPHNANGKQIFTTVSIGISSEPIPPGQEFSLAFIEALIKDADTAMYHAKRLGGNQFGFNNDHQNMVLERNYQLDLEMKEALLRNEFSVVYQPIVNLKNSKIVGAEALLRWQNRHLGTVAPNEFIPILEKNGLIVPVGKWILATVCSQMKYWQENGHLMQRICVNVSPIQFKDKQFIPDLKEILNESLLDASYLEVEITEGTILDIENSSRTINELKDLGVKVSIDDFGTGYSSLSYLKQLPIDTLKIDKSFIDDLDRDGEIIANTIISMGKNLNFRVIAEGIESIDQLDYLKKQKCHEGQGYYFSRPIGNKEITELFGRLG
ncbi:EAL and GGDEF domain-containing protein [Oceanobacillus massiliensis]|uniref:sensor domain-containing protein n=3 Tax=Oceanobacillus massiliensis TaxID=1465765 RepID=UPI0002892A41|nr:GGDEF domain-containing phosphodiesterase [Oceanobacillus massiliensis]